MEPREASSCPPILLIRPTLKIGGGFVVVSRVSADLQEAEVEKLDVTGNPDHQWPGLSGLITKCLAEGDRRFVIDLQRVPWMNSSGLGRLIELWRLIEDGGGCAALVCRPGRILTILEISQVALVMRPVPTLAEAVRRLSAPPKS